MSPDLFFDSVARIDMLLRSPDPAQAFQEIRPMLEDSALSAYFFDHLQNPLWLSVLEDGGVFRTPPSSQVDEKGRVAFPAWPQSRFLARMASNDEAQTSVLRIALAVSATDNMRVHEDLADIALALPATRSALLLPQIVSWCQSPYQFRLPLKLGALIAKLAGGHRTVEALALTRVLMAVSPDPRSGKDVPEHLRLPLEPVARFDVWQYEQILTKDIPPLVDAAGTDALIVLCDLLESAILASSSRSDSRRDDYSWIWRPAIEDHEQNRRESVASVLVSGVRDASERIIATRPREVGMIVSLLEERGWVVFRRIALHVLRQSPEGQLVLIEERLTDKERFDEAGIRHEYTLLAAACFARLSAAARATILGWIDAGPEVEAFSRRYREETGRDASPQELQQYADVWRRDRLEPLKDVLDETWRLRFTNLVTRFGGSEHPEFPAYASATWVGPTSAKTAEELKSMAPAAVVAFLRDWQPTEKWFADSREGLARALASAIQLEPDRFAGIAQSFAGLDPTYVRALIGGLEDALRESRQFTWQPVIGLCEWVMQQPRAISARRSTTHDEDPDWGWTRKAIASLLSAAFENKRSGFPSALHTRAWNVLVQLTDDPEPTIEDETQYGGENMDPATLSINTVRGEAMHAVIHYALWLRAQSLAEGASSEPRLSITVQQVLENHLRPEYDPSLTVRSVYGRWFPWLVLLDATWARRHVERIFPADPESVRFWRAAWDTYVVFNVPYDNVFSVLESEYRRAVERLGTGVPNRSRLADPDQRLAEHLMAFYWRGRIDMSDRTGVLRQFYETASGDLRGRALEFIGRALRDTKELPPDDIAERLKALWTWRLSDNRRPGFSEEVSRFGWWFASGKLDDAWALEQQEQVLTIAHKADPVHLVLEHLAKVCAVYPRKAIRCLRMILESDREQHALLGFEEHIRKILVVSIGSNDAVARDEARVLVHWLGSKGHLEFRELLSGGT